MTHDRNDVNDDDDDADDDAFLCGFNRLFNVWDTISFLS